MKLFLIILLFFTTQYGVEAYWYGNHAVGYTANSGVTNCIWDWDNAWWGHSTLGHAAVADNNSSTSVQAETSMYFSIPNSGSARCLFWDAASPLVTNLSYTDWWVKNSAIPVSWEATDTGWSLLQRYELREFRATYTVSWYTPTLTSAFVATWRVFASSSLSWNSWSNTLAFSNAGLNNGFAYQYQLRVRDRAQSQQLPLGNYYTPYRVWTEVAYVDKTSPTVNSISYTDGWLNIPDQDVTVEMSDTWGSDLRELIIRQYVATQNLGVVGSYSLLTTRNINVSGSAYTHVENYTNQISGRVYRYTAELKDLAQYELWETWVIVNGSDRTFVDTIPAITTTINDSIPGLWTNATSVTVTSNFTDTGGSGLQNYQIEYRSSPDNPTFSTWWSVYGDTRTRAISGNSDSDTELFTLLNNTAYQFRIRVQDESMFENWDIWSNPWLEWPLIYVDRTPPVLTDATNTNPQHMLADDDFDYDLSISTAAGSPIISVTYRRENTWNTAISSNLPLLWPVSPTPLQSTWWFDWDINQVDNFRESIWPAEWWREYTFELVEICDEAWNCSVDSPITSDHYVYADTITWPINADIDITSLSIPWLVASNIARNSTWTVVDRFWNNIIPAASIGREIDFNFQANNELRMNQYNNTWADSALYVDNIGTTDIFIPTWPTGIWTLTNVSPELTDIYNFQFYVYAPTNNEDLSVPWGVTVDDITIDVRDTIHPIGSRNNITIVSWDTAIVRAAPLFTTDFSWEIEDFWFIEWVNQVSSIEVIKTDVWITTFGDNLRLEFWQVAWPSSNVANPQFQMSVNWAVLTEWTQALTGSIPVVIANSLTTQSIDSQMIQDTAVPTLEDSYLASIVQYDIWPWTVTYPYDILWKDTYYNWVAVDNTIQTWVRILGNTVSQTNQELTVNQFVDDVRILWRLTKSSFRRDIEENVYSTILPITPKSASALSLTVASTDLWSSSWSDAKFNTGSLANRGLALFDDSILYYWDLGWATVILSGTTNIEWVKTIVVENGNIYITGDIENSDNDGILWIVTLSDDRDDVTVWNIYIDPSVRDIHASMYTNKAVISYDGSNELDGTTNQSILVNQLYVKWSIFSENTIWWSRADPLICPFYVNSNCSNFPDTIHRNNAQKYDLNFIRRFFVYDSNTNGTIEYDGSDIPANWGQVADGWTSYQEFPLIVEYNPLIQQTPPPFFE